MVLQIPRHLPSKQKSPIITNYTDEVKEKSGKTIRTLKIGKNSETNLSSYIKFDEKPETLLADRNLRSIFEVKAEDLEQQIEQPQSEQPQAEEQTSEN